MYRKVFRDIISRVRESYEREKEKNFKNRLKTKL